MSLERHRQDWEELAEDDALWAILSTPEKRGGGWDVEQFFATGIPELELVMSHARALGVPASMDAALDFGCGVGRVTRAMVAYFQESVGVDVSTSMVDAARRMNSGMSGLDFVHNARSDLHVFDDRRFDLVYSYIVLQHLPTRDLVESYVREFVRVLRPGGLLVFQLPDDIPYRRRIQPRRRAYALLRRLGVSPWRLNRRMGLTPIRMVGVSRHRIQQLLEASGAQILDIDVAIADVDGISNVTYWATRGD